MVSVTMESPMKQFYLDKTVFVTGGTGFLGVLFVEKLLRCKAKMVYVLIRPKKNKSSIERIKETFVGDFFNKLKQQDPDYMTRIKLIEGDTFKADLGISEDDRKAIIANVEMIIHAASDVRFDRPLVEMILTNVRETRTITLLAEQMTKLIVFAYISTAYSQFYRDKIEEKFYPPPYDPDEMIRIAGKMYAVIGRRNGRILSADLTQGSGTFTVMAVIPVIESLNFAHDIRKQTSGLACPQLTFSHWEVSLVILLSSLCCIPAEGESTKTKRQYFPSDVQYQTSTIPYDENDYDVYGRTFKKKAAANAANIKQIEEKQPDGSYHYEFETENGIRQKQTSIQNGLERVVRGSFSYVGPDGVTYTVNYIADRNGYRASGAHLHVQPDAVADMVNQQFVTTTVLSSPAIDSTIIPITNRPFRRRYHAKPFFRKHLLANPTPQPITYSSTPYPIINSTPYVSNPTAIGSYVSNAQGIPFSTTQSPIQNPTIFSPIARGFQYSTPNPLQSFGISSTTPGPYTVAPTQCANDDTVYITPPPRRQHNLSSQDYLHRELLPPFALGLPFENDNVGIPNVRPLFPDGRDPSSYNSYRPSGFESRYPFLKMRSVFIAVKMNIEMDEIAQKIFYET